MQILITIFAGFVLSGCVRIPSQPTMTSRGARGSLNKQIEKFNADRKLTPTMSIHPIDRRVSRVEYDRRLDQVTTFDQDDKPFIVLKREPDGRFKGVLEQPYHELAFSGPDGSHSWGHVLAEFYTGKGLF